MDQSIKSCLVIAFLSAIFVGQAHGQLAEYSETQQRYWVTMLPNTPMPQSLFDVLPPLGKDDGEGDANIATYLKGDTERSGFILEKNLVIPGTKIDIQFKRNMPGPRFPSPQMAQRMPSLTSENLPQLLQHFGITPDSDTATVVRKALEKCEEPEDFMGGVQFCAENLEKMVDLVTLRFGDPKQTNAVSMATVQATETPLEYVILGARKIAEDQSLIGCHKSSFPIGLFYCHQPIGTAAYAISLVKVQTGEKIEAYSTCHEHSSDWFPKDLFKKLNVQKGAKVCHINFLDDVIWYKA